MKLESLVCDVEGCVDAAIFQIHHFMVLTEPHAPGANLHFDLCKKHAEAFAMNGDRFLADEGRLVPRAVAGVVMKLIRLTDDRYILDAGREISAAQMEEIREYWKDWWSKTLEVPEVVVIAGSSVPLEYEDRREPDIESRLRALEEHVHVTGLDYSGKAVQKP